MHAARIAMHAADNTKRPSPLDPSRPCASRTFRHRGVCPPCDGISDADDCIVGPLRAAEDLPM
eukprot:CAMPEP_0115747266 /NCGR_PEP_ID=MMETSP0272-20121206/93063_1 /TAXON_ID=71861 /ORGANISM="Scrippsiella trochoidea, Strain CCMP3099" /LENGTH=62 /DNA_ID=CAMNT_0003192231 /DNA_START=1081 /DNA_END=1266 /DNA_ORIENTATION=+